MFNSKGLLVSSRTDLQAHQRPLAHEHAPVGDFLAAVRMLRPTAIIGAAGIPGTFTQQVIEEMAAINARPIVFALSNPTSRSECTAEQAYLWSGGRVLFAAGSPFDPVTIAGRTFVPRQGNNSYIFPGLGLGLIATRSTRVTDEMFMATARSLAQQVTDEDLAQGSLYPPLAKVREVSAQIATVVAEVAYAQNLAAVPRPDNLMEFVKSQMYDPHYRAYV
jgi:malate dehydrogenase (oxaloacetate-decarboxylating)(NADP+)